MLSVTQTENVSIKINKFCIWKWVRDTISTEIDLAVKYSILYITVITSVQIVIYIIKESNNNNNNNNNNTNNNNHK